MSCDVMVSTVASDNSFKVPMETLFLISTILVFGQRMHLYENIYLHLFLSLTSKKIFLLNGYYRSIADGRVRFIEKIKTYLVFSFVYFVRYNLLLFWR